MTTTTPATTYVVLIYGDESGWTSATPEQRAKEYGRHEEFARRAGEEGHELTSGAELREIATATFVRGGTVGVTAGPYAELAEQLGGLYVVRTADADGLARLVADCFREDRGLFEIRPTTPSEEQDPTS
ncbi:YCII-related protein [Beutenbergia cavernae DSM 12333]|uniref:YCII-related protein n=1 Tax=Beutenbergia cavernae (strain ATCC BAA-8 / DSM 12333 / CCUG 43141 / JCM 11478 / NBRC 16432 / NCIMB 13614 / HKI 0122) TaxID=471853 RepID=C5C3U6_BEUC1|nr:YciI family protein [Beutenbergia cavernae]ACQ82005.1 YCII-related protein [Beutenbergia cavernae DSM 12333]